MRDSRTWWMVLVPIVALLVGLGAGALVGPQLSPEEEYELGTAILMGSAEFPVAAGMASFEFKPDGIFFKVVVQNILSGNSIPVDAFIDGTKVSSIPLEIMAPVPGSFTGGFVGKGLLDLRLPAGAPFPTVRTGSVVEIKTASGALIVSGKLG